MYVHKCTLKSALTMLQNPFTLRLGSRHWHWAWLHTSQQHALNFNQIVEKHVRNSNEFKTLRCSVTLWQLKTWTRWRHGAPSRWRIVKNPIQLLRCNWNFENENPWNKFLKSAHHPKSISNASSNVIELTKTASCLSLILDLWICWFNSLKGAQEIKNQSLAKD